MDYVANSEKSKTGGATEKKVVTKVVTGAVVVKKKSLGQKFKDVFIEADFRGVTRYVVSEVLLPAARNMIVDASQKGIERMIYGPDAPRRSDRFGNAPGRAQFGGSPLFRTDYRHPTTRPPMQRSSAYSRPGRNDFIHETREDAEIVLQHLFDIVERYGETSVADLHELMGLPISNTDQKWGWTNLAGANVRPDYGGFIVDLPPIEPIS